MTGPDRQPTLAILTYVDDHPGVIEEFSWLHKSWIHSGAWRTSDIVAVCHPGASGKLPNEPGVVKILRDPVCAPGTAWEGYPYINSIACLHGEHTAHLPQQYSHVLRTDCDVFLTRHIVDFRPEVFVFGRGHYIQNQTVRDRIAEFAGRHGLVHQGVFNCGNSLMAKSAETLAVIQGQTLICDWLLEAFRDDPGQWPGWCKNVLTMYAAELAINHQLGEHVRFAFGGLLDFEPFREDEIDAARIPHIHAFPTEEFWSKARFRRGEYADREISAQAPGKVNAYCHWIASTPIERIREAREV